MKNLSFGQKLLVAFGALIALVISAYALISDHHLKNTSQTYIEAMTSDAVEQGKSGIANWMNTRLKITEEAGTALESAKTDSQARSILQFATNSGGFIDVYIGQDSGRMLMPNESSQSALPDGYDPRVRPWYKLAKSEGRSTFTDPYQDASTGKMIISAAALSPKGDYSGVIGSDVSLSEVERMLSEITLGETGFAALITGSGTILYHPDSDLISKDVKDVIGEKADLSGVQKNYQINDKEWIVGFHKIEDARSVDWYLATFSDEALINGPLYEARTVGVIVSILSLIIAMTILHFGVRALLSPIRNLKKAMTDIASGDADLTKRIPVETNDELGDLAQNFNTFVSNLQDLIRDIQEGASKLDTNVDSLKMTSKSSRTSVEKQQSEIHMIAAAINEMSASASEIAQNAQHTADSSHKADSDAKDSMVTVAASRDAVSRLSSEIGTATDVIDNLGKDVSEITGVLEVIQGIAEQTNLLALNAAIEAARAGDAGRGFAVVADEVRNLAQRTQASTGEINSMIEKLKKGAGDAVDVMKSSSSTSDLSLEKAEEAMEKINRIAESIAAISDMTSQIATASEEQTSVTEDLSVSITRISDQAEEAASSTRENDTYSEAVDDIGKAFVKNVGRFKV